MKKRIHFTFKWILNVNEQNLGFGYDTKRKHDGNKFRKQKWGDKNAEILLIYNFKNLFQRLYFLIR